MPPSEAPESVDREALARDLKQLLARMNRKVEVRLKSGGGLVGIKRAKGGVFELSVDEGKFLPESFDHVAALAISQIESLETAAVLEGDDTYAEPVRLYRERTKQPAHKLFYETVFQTIAIHKGAVHIPILREKLAHMGNQAGAALTVAKENIPLHLQFLLGLMGVTQNLDTAVQNAIGDLESAGTLGFVKHIENEAGEKLKRINDDIWPLYDYFLQKDKAEWKKEKAVKKAAEKTPDTAPDKTEGEIRKKTKEKAEKAGKPEGDEKEEKEKAPPEQTPEEQTPGSEEETYEGSTPEQPSEQAPSQPDSAAPDNDTPDHKRTYKTPEGGNFEDDPNGLGYSLEISPPLKGYYAIDRKNRFSHTALLEWDCTAQYARYTQTPALEKKKYTISGQLRGRGIKPIPLPSGYALDLDSLQCTGDKPEILRDQNGNFFFRIKSHCDFSIEFAQEKKPFLSRPTQQDKEPIYQGIISAKGEDALQQARKKPRAPREQTKIIRDYIRQNHKYPPGKDGKERLEAARKTQLELKKCSNPTEYVQKLDAAQYLECYSANTLMVAMLRNLGIASRVVTGHHVQGINKKGNAEINSGNGHGWCEIWDGRAWVRFDATPPGDPQEEEEKKDDKGDEEDGQQGQGEDAQDGGEDTPGDGEEGDGDGEEGDGDSEGKGGKKDGKKSEKGGKGAGEASDDEDDDGESGEPFDAEKEFERMYRELQDYIAEHPDETEVEEAQEQIEAEELEMAPPEPVDPIDQTIDENYPDLPKDKKEQMANFVRGFLRECEKMKQIKNPDAAIDPEHPMLIDALRAILDRVISRSMIEEEVPRYPVNDGDVLVDPVALYFDEQAGQTDSQVWLRQELEEREELRVVKVRRRKILDGSGSMGDRGKLTTQQLIETLENIVTAEKQQELDVLSRQLNRDLRLETETWQFGVDDPMGEFSGFRRLKKLGPEFNVVEQALTWYAAGEAVGGTNDFDPLEEILNEIMQEEAAQKLADPNQPSTLDRIKAGFCIRELKNLAELEAKDEKDLTPEEKIYLTNLHTNRSQFEDFLTGIQGRHPDIEPVIEVVEVTSDGGSNTPARVQTIIKNLRSIGVIVVAYGIGSDGRAVEATYANSYNPMEGGFYCVNLLDYPRKKLDAWKRILDKV